MWLEAHLLGPGQGQCKLPKQYGLWVTFTAIFVKGSLKSRIMFGSINEQAGLGDVTWESLATHHR